jgi:hypothetical protein
MTSRRANAVNTSRRFVFAIARRIGCVAKRPATITPTMAPTTFASPSHRKPDPVGSIESSGTIPTSGMAAMSWKSRIPNAALPKGDPSRPRSFIVWTAIAVDESATASPATNAPRHGRPARSPPAASTAPQRPIWRAPPPKTLFLSPQSLAGSSSSPIRKSINTTPNSAKCRMDATSRTSPNPKGPITQPAAR